MSKTTTAPGSPTAADALLQTFARAGYTHARPPVLQPAEPFLDLSGEDIRKSLYLTTDASGEELCLRPDLTIPVARDYLASAQAGRPAGFYYLCPVFRYRGGQASEFNQAGVESFGRQDRAEADAEMLALGLEATAAFGVKDVDIRTGDVGLFAALIEALDLYPVWKRRLIKDFNRKISLAQDLQRLTLETGKTRNEYEGVLAALAGLVFAARLNTATPKAGLGFELDVIAACFIGGASASGGVGKITGAVIGALLVNAVKFWLSSAAPDVWPFILSGLIVLVVLVFPNGLVDLGKFRLVRPMGMKRMAAEAGEAR